MIWFIFVCVVAFVLVWLFRGRNNPGAMVIPALTLAVTIAFFSALLIWLNEGSGRTGAPPAEPVSVATPLITPGELELTDMQVVQTTPATSYQLTGTIRNTSNARLDSFALTVIMQDCKDGACTVIDEDTALVLLRIQPGESADLRKTFTFPIPRLGMPASLEWAFRIDNIRASR